MDPSKVARPDGFSALLYQRYWSTVWDTIIDIVQKFWSQQLNIEQINYTYLCLISKVRKHDKPIDF